MIVQLFPIESLYIDFVLSIKRLVSSNSVLVLVLFWHALRRGSEAPIGNVRLVGRKPLEDLSSLVIVTVPTSELLAYSKTVANQPTIVKDGLANPLGRRVIDVSSLVGSGTSSLPMRRS